MKVAIVGSRPSGDGFTDADRNRAVREYVYNLPADTIVVSGGAPGVDSWAQQAAKSAGLITIVVYPAWARADGSTDRRAGIKRNPVIVEIADKVVAFWDGKSTGTKNTIDLARAAGKEVEVVT